MPKELLDFFQKKWGLGLILLLIVPISFNKNLIEPVKFKKIDEDKELANFFSTISEIESNNNDNVVSPANAIGRFQIRKIYIEDTYGVSGQEAIRLWKRSKNDVAFAKKTIILAWKKWMPEAFKKREYDFLIYMHNVGGPRARRDYLKNNLRALNRNINVKKLRKSSFYDKIQV